MNEPIISPWVFYWIDVLSTLDDLPVILAFLGVALVIIGWVLIYTEMDGEIPCICKKIAVVYLSIFVFSAAISIFIPSKETMYQMLIASYVTPNNVEYIKNEVKDSAYGIVDSIIDASIKLIKAKEGK